MKHVPFWKTGQAQPLSDSIWLVLPLDGVPLCGAAEVCGTLGLCSRAEQVPLIQKLDWGLLVAMFPHE